MRILVTNDDGIHAPGLQVARDIAAELSDDVWVVAPEVDQSGAAHSLTLRDPLRLRKVEDQVFAVSGTPTDCVLMATRQILQDAPPTLVLSGVNRGANMAEDVNYSGTVAGAMEGATLGIRSVALSLAVGFDDGGGTKWQTALDQGPALIQQLLAAPWPDGVFMNINFPDVTSAEVGDTVITRQGKRDQQVLRMEERHDTWGRPYYWYGFDRILSNPPEGTDLRAIYSGQVSVTPLHSDLTAHAVVGDLAKRMA